MKNIIKDISENLMTLAKSSTREFFISSPWIKKDALNLLLKNFSKKEIQLKVLTTLHEIDFCKGISDIEAIEMLIAFGATIKIIENLHAKIYISDSTGAIISSANLTNAGIAFSESKTKNLEIGVYLTDANEVLYARKIFNDYFEDALEVKESDFPDFKQNVESEKKQVAELEKLERDIPNFYGKLLERKRKAKEMNNRSVMNSGSLLNEEKIENFYKKAHENIKRTLNNTLPTLEIKDNNRGLREARKYLRTYKIKGFSELNFSIQPERNNLVSLSVRDNSTDKKYSEIFAKIRQPNIVQKFKQEHNIEIRLTTQELIEKEKNLFPGII
jgi:hypothetical protein